MTANRESPRQLILNFPASPEYSFSNFIVSDSSRFAFDAAQNICSEKPVGYQTLYIAGGKGLGKTHLLIAIGNRLAETGTNARALYLSSPEFVDKLENQEQADANDMVKRLGDADFLLVDDVDCLAGHKPSQEKLYFIYNALVEQGKKIVFTGKQIPGDLAQTESFLTSRFKWGMTAELKPMDEETTVQVIQKICRETGLALPEKILTYLLTRLPRDFPSIRASLAAINAESLEKKSKVTLPLVKSALHLS